ncbi:hypothetical protein [Streptomyces sp. SP18CS02]|uniref:hypothetical protein n=1 Tax=Streptomyces sp. SP18CS02 TaxID=3002531 RepID=UPI002E7813FF|nr:hypothetical protein [Streptomyces sp. SP18CS02]MEE1752858.1 hypothetical protein [Streptomyces sp. SP18CS02]
MTPSLEWLGHVPTAVSAVHALLALGQVCRSKLLPRRAGAADEPGCPCWSLPEVRVDPVAYDGAGRAGQRELDVRVDVVPPEAGRVVVRVTVAPGPIPEKPSREADGLW